MSGLVFRCGGDFAEMQITRAQGCHIFDQNGRPILDFTSGQMSAFSATVMRKLLKLSGISLPIWIICTVVSCLTLSSPSPKR